MTGTHDLMLFVIAGLLLNVAPGPDTLYIVGRSATQGLKAGVTAALGIGAGILVHITAAALGLSALLAVSATAFAVLKLAGAAYLVYVGVSLILSAGAEAVAASAAGYTPVPLRTVFLQGFLTNVLNPKVALFFVAFLPQFVAPDAPDKALAFLFLGAIFNVNGTLWNVFVAWSAARLSGGFVHKTNAMRWFSRIVGALFVGLGVRLAFTRDV